MARPGIFEYFKEAFKVPYNVILVSGGLLAGLVSLQPLVVWPLVAALEIVYLLTLSHHPRFQNLVRARREGRRTAGTAEVAERLAGSLDAERRERFEQVRGRCEELQSSLTVAGAGGEEPLLGDILEGTQAESVNKLLWVFLRTLAFEQAVEAFCAAVPRRQITEQLARAEAELARTDLSETMRAAHADNVEVLRKRLDNLQRAEENLESLRARLVRIENSVLLIQEQALTRRDPGFIEAEVKAATAGLTSMEEMLRTVEMPELGADTAGPTPEFLAPARQRERDSG
jgi:hypothetical protein